MDFQTDLALERHELIRDYVPKGIESIHYRKYNINITKIKISDEEGSKNLGKPIGTYITVEIPDLIFSSPASEDVICTIADELRSLLPKSGTVLVVGLGNDKITPDSIGPESVSAIFATRHIEKEFISSTGLDSLRHVACFTPGVLGKTGIESAESIKGIVKAVNPVAIIVIDALAARRVSRLGKTIQFSDTGICPGSGIGNKRNAVTKETMGVPVISVGIPTVVNAQTLINDFVEKSCKLNLHEDEDMIVTPREIDSVVEKASKIISATVNKALQPQLTVDEILMLAGN